MKDSYSRYLHSGKCWFVLYWFIFEINLDRNSLTKLFSIGVGSFFSNNTAFCAQVLDIVLVRKLYFLCNCLYMYTLETVDYIKL